MLSSWRIVVPPAADPVSLEEASQFLRLAEDSDAPTVERLIRSASHHVEEITRRCFVSRTIEARFDAWPCQDLRRPDIPPDLILPSASPLASVERVTYVDTDGAVQTLATDVYRVEAHREPGRLRLAFNRDWPNVRADREVITVRYDAGYGTDADVPDTAKTAILMLVAHWFENREAVDVATGGTVSEIPFGFESIIGNLTVREVT